MLKRSLRLRIAAAFAIVCISVGAWLVDTCCSILSVARGRPWLAWGVLAAGLLAGFVLGGARMMQGAHFISHTLWSALVCWVVLAALAAVILPEPAR